MEETMKTMPAGEFKAKCLRVMEEVKKYRTPVVITKKGKPVAKLVPADEPRDIFGCMADKFKIVGDIEAPVLPPLDEWDVVRGRDWLTRPEPRPRRKKAGSRKRSR
jgi:prevent-host-death family protein